MFKKSLIALLALAIAGVSASARGLTTKELEVRSVCLAHEYAAVEAMGTKLALDDAASDPNQASVAHAYADDPNWKIHMIEKLSPLERTMFARARASNETSATMAAFETRVRKECFATYGMADTFDGFPAIQQEPGKGGWFSITPEGYRGYWEHRDAQGRVDDTKSDHVPGYPTRDPTPSPGEAAVVDEVTPHEMQVNPPICETTVVAKVFPSACQVPVDEGMTEGEYLWREQHHCKERPEQAYCQ